MDQTVVGELVVASNATLTVTSSTLTVQGNATFSGTIVLQGSTLIIEGSASFVGTTTMSSGSSMNVSGSVEFSGAITMSGSSSILVVGDISVNGTVALSGSAALSLLGDFTVQGDGTLSLSGDGSSTSSLVSVEGVLTILGRFILEASATYLEQQQQQQQQRQAVAGPPLIRSTTQVFGNSASMGVTLKEAKSLQSSTTVFISVASFQQSVGTPTLTSAKVFSADPAGCVEVVDQQLLQTASGLSASLSIQNSCFRSTGTTSSGLSQGTIIGVAIAAVAGGILVGVVIALVLYQQNRRKDVLFQVQLANQARDDRQQELNLANLRLAQSQGLSNSQNDN